MARSRRREGAKRALGALVFGLVLAPLRAWADDATGDEAPRSSVDVPPRVLPWADPWSEGRARGFVAARVDAGFPFVQARLSSGYGKPHYSWGGVEAGPLASSGFVAGFAGLRFEHPLVDVRSSVLYVASLRHSFLEPKESYDRRDVDERDGGKAGYFAWDSEVEWNVPLGPGAVQGETEGMRVPSQGGRFVYVETLRVVAAPEWVARQRLGYDIPLRDVEGLRVAPAAEVVWIPERDDALVWRAGLLVRWWLFHDLELRIDVLPVVASRDSLGNVGGEPIRLALRWQWATAPTRDER